ncbi:MAG: SAM-dependent methyltransferase [Candidatus Omnitrophica bacterium]|nr:SAM-dependent methyltransferase [Candidatus Omnitrophota bacterium]
MKSKIPKIICLLLCALLVFEQPGFAQALGQMDVSGYFLSFSSPVSADKYRPLHLRYFSCNPEGNGFDLLLDKGDRRDIKEQALEDSTRGLLDYFVTALTLPNDSFWVNLRPDSAESIIDDYLAQTEAGRILLEADVQLKKDTAGYTSPGTPEGRLYWDKLYKKAGEILGSDNVTIPTLVRPWIVPDEVIVGETQNSVYVYKATLKVMLEDDYLKSSAVYNFKDPRLKALNEYSSQLLKEEIVPRLTREINTSSRYAALRQVYYSLVIAQWFKARFRGKSGFYSSLIDKRNLTGLISSRNWSKQQYFKQYQDSFKNGEYDFKESVHGLFGRSVRSYFSGGIQLVPEEPFPQPPAGADVSTNGPYSAINANDRPLQKDYLVGMSGSSDGRIGKSDTPGARPVSNIYEAVAERIRNSSGKKITFAEFMNIEQGHPAYGYYTNRAKIEKDAPGGFLTFAEGKEGEYLAQAISGRLMQKWLMLGRPSTFTVVEMGAGNGTLAFNVLNLLKAQDAKFPESEPTLYRSLRYVIVEISQENLKVVQEGKLGEFKDKVSWVGSDARDLSQLRQEFGLITGVFLSNELPDDFGIHRIRIDENGRPQEIYVSMDDNGMLQDLPGDLSDPRIGAYLNYLKSSGIELKAGKEIAVNLESLDWQEEMERSLGRGEIITVDYAFGDLGQQHHKLEAERSFSQEGDAVWSGRHSDMGVRQIYRKVRDGEPVNITSMVDFGYLSARYSDKYDYSGVFDQAGFIEAGGFVEKTSSAKAPRVIIHLSDGQWMRMSPFKVLIQSRMSERLSSEPAVSSPELAREDLNGPFTNFMQWFDRIIQEFSGVLTTRQLEDLAGQLGISSSEFMNLYRNAVAQAQAAYKFSQALNDDGRENVYLFRDSFALYAAEKIKGGRAHGLFLSKASFRSFFGSMAGDTVIHFMFQAVKKEMGYARDEAVPVEDFPEFKNRFFNLLSGLMDSQEPSGKRGYGEFEGYAGNLRQAADRALQYMSSLGLDMETIKRRGVRFIATTLTGSIVFFLQGVVYDQLRKDGLSEAEALEKTDGFMFYSKLSEAMSFSRSEQQGRAVKNKFYPIEFSRGLGLGANSVPSVVEKTEYKNKFLLQVSILRNELIRLNGENAPAAPQVSNGPGDSAGGIDFRAIPLVSQPSLNAGFGSGLSGLQSDIDLGESWRQIDNMLKAGILPSSQRIKEHLWACNRAKDMEKETARILASLVDILRMQEDLALKTGPSLKEALALLESVKPGSKTRVILGGL